MKALVLGAGWYGCHACVVLDDMGIQYKICDVANDFFAGSSSKNQNRLHLGFHYPRSFKTRSECQNGFDRFMKVYGGFTAEIPNNYYCIDSKSLMDCKSYAAIYRYENIPFEESALPCALPFLFDSSTIDGVIRVDERFIDFRRAGAYFKQRLEGSMVKNYSSGMLSFEGGRALCDGEAFDIVVDCTYSTVNSSMFYENCVSLVYELNEPSMFAITVVDGPFWSLYPYDIDGRLYTLTDVEHTPAGTEDARAKMEEKVRRYIPDFDERFAYRGHFVSKKAKPGDVGSDDRSLAWCREDNVIRFSGGKLTGIFAMEEVLRRELAGQPQQQPQTSRETPRMLPALARGTPCSPPPGTPPAPAPDLLQ